MTLRHGRLTIWCDANRLILDIERAVRRFPRDHKYTLGSVLRRHVMDVPPALVHALVNSETSS